MWTLKDNNLRVEGRIKNVTKIVNQERIWQRGESSKNVILVLKKRGQLSNIFLGIYIYICILMGFHVRKVIYRHVKNVEWCRNRATTNIGVLRKLAVGQKFKKNRKNVNKGGNLWRLKRSKFCNQKWVL